jgi:hypothetical protein
MIARQVRATPQTVDEGFLLDALRRSRLHDIVRTAEIQPIQASTNR